MAFNKERTVLVRGLITDELVTDVVLRLADLDLSNSNEPIYMLIYSPGGNIAAFKNLLAAIRALKSELNTVLIGGSESCASILFLQGKRRFMLDGIDIMFHQPASHFGNRLLKYADLVHETKELKKDYDLILKEMYEKTKIPKEVIDKNMDAGDYILSSKKALKFGVATDIIKCFAEI